MNRGLGPTASPGVWHASTAALAVAAAIVAGPSGQAGPIDAGEKRAQARGLPDAQVRGLRGEDELARVYDLILDARFENLDADLRRACGPAPVEACHVLDATALWWRIQLDPENRALDDEFSTAVERAIRTTESWTVRDPDSAEAWFYLGGAYAARVQWRVLRDERLSAARDGKRIKEALERALTLDPGLDDAYFGIGMYRYYADVAPAAARILRFLLLLPGGDREAGLAQMLRARARGRLLQGEADYQLHLIYLWYEQQTDRALELLRDLDHRYPANPLFLAQIAEIQDTYEHDIMASLDTWRSLLARVRANRVNLPAVAEVRARLGLARQLDTLARTDEAIDHLERIVASKPEEPYAALALAYLRLGEAHDRLNARSDAMAAYRLASMSAPSEDPYDIRDQAAERLRRLPNARQAEAFRLSLEGWRKLEQKDAARAVAALERALALNPRDGVAHYRYAVALQAQRKEAAALGEFELAIRNAERCPAPILGAAYLESGRLHERAGRREQARSAYRAAATLFGASEETRREATRALARQ
jgi:tetratricopeptide (TPR) repeat protein